MKISAHKQNDVKSYAKRPMESDADLGGNLIHPETTEMSIGGAVARDPLDYVELGLSNRNPLTMVESGGAPKALIFHHVFVNEAVKDTTQAEEIKEELRGITNLGSDTLPEHLPMLEKLLGHSSIAGTSDAEEIQNCIDRYYPCGVCMNGRALLYPYADRFDDLFVDVQPYNRNTPREETVIAKMGAGRYPGDITDFMVFSSNGVHEMARVRVQPAVVEGLRGSMLDIENDSIHFKVIHHESTNRALVIAMHSQILGSRYLAYVASASLPEPFQAKIKTNE